MQKEVTLIITSCNRLDLLKRTIVSFEKFNTYPIKEAIIIEDSGKTKVNDQLNQLYGKKYKIIFNTPPLKQIGSIDRAYKEVNTEYIFHCEDDWEFYRPNFIEDSIEILESNPKIKQVALRSIHHDTLINHPTVGIVNKFIDIKGHRVYKLIMKDCFSEYDWVTCSFNPGVIRKKDYDLIGTYSSRANTEGEISKWYKDKGFYSVALENDAVKHIGWDDSSMGHFKKQFRLNVRVKNFIKSFLNLFGKDYTYNPQ